MIISLLMIAGILFLALQREDKVRVPSPLGLIALSFAAHYAFEQVPILTGNAGYFSTLAISLLSTVLISDSLKLRLADLKARSRSLFYLAAVAATLPARNTPLRKIDGPRNMQ